MATTETFETEQAIFDKVVEKLEANEAPWHRQNVLPRNVFNKRFYKGMNVVTCWMSGSPSQAWATAKQWADHGCPLTAHASPTEVRFFMPLDIVDGTRRWITRTFSVYAAEAVEGGDLILRKEGAEKVEASPAAFLDWAKSLPITFEASSSRHVSFDRVKNAISMPLDYRIRDEVDATILAHAIIAATGHPDRLDRKSELEGEEARAYEALIGDIGAAFILAHFGLKAQPTDDMINHMALWVDMLRRGVIVLRLAANEAGKAIRSLPEFPSEQDDVAEALEPITKDSYTVVEGVIARNKLAKLVKAGIVPAKAARAFKALVSRRTDKQETAA